ncbi:fructosamine kinase family protein [Candidatus Leptofilum sp.]|uniref:fructosamine kinase family protein n=1 Tax=Candidatus Leptofilum sp. TaxID=3241576 RepID=UPI003B58F616
MDVRMAVETAVSTQLQAISPLSGGQIGQVYRVQLADDTPLVVKFDDGPEPQLDIEGAMLRYLAEHTELPVPGVIHSEPHLLIMEFMPGRSHFSPQAEANAAEHLAALHGVTAPTFGFPFMTLIGAFTQPNDPTESWLEFFREQRIFHLMDEGLRLGRLPQSFVPRLERLCGQWEQWLAEPERSSLIHGDVWTSNVLAENGRITAFLDPALYFGIDEMELAYIALFNSFSTLFFQRYEEIRPLPPGFYEERRHLYSLYPLLSHVCHFGGSYVGMVDSVLRRFGF